MLELHSRDHLDDPDKKRFFNQHLFAEVAPKYDFVTRALSIGRDQAWKRQLIDAFPPSRDLAAPVCVDLACGTGDLCQSLERRYPDGRVIGIDLSADMLALAKARLAKVSGGGSGAIEFRCGDMGAIALDDASVDVISGSYALRNAADLDKALHEIARVLKPGGRAAFLDFSKPSSKVLAGITHALLKIWGGFWGLVLHRNTDVYGYIAESLARFPNRRKLQGRFARAGLFVEESKLFYGGLLQLVVLRKGEVSASVLVANDSGSEAPLRG